MFTETDFTVDVRAKGSSQVLHHWVFGTEEAAIKQFDEWARTRGNWDVTLVKVEKTHAVLKSTKVPTAT